MPMGIVSDDEFQSEIRNSGCPTSTPHSPDNFVSITDVMVPSNSFNSHIRGSGRKEGDVNVPPSVRTIIADTDLMEGRSAAISIAKDFGLSESSVSAYSNGATSCSTYNKPDNDLNEFIKGRKRKVTNSALTKLKLAMGCLSEDKIDASSAKEISSIAKDMASVVKLMDDSPTSNPINTVERPQFLVYAPQIRDERHFGDVIQSKE